MPPRSAQPRCGDVSAPVVVARVRRHRNKCAAPTPLKTLGTCLECHDGTPADPSDYTVPPTHTLAA